MGCHERLNLRDGQIIDTINSSNQYLLLAAEVGVFAKLVTLHCKTQSVTLYAYQRHEGQVSTVDIARTTRPTRR